MEWDEAVAGRGTEARPSAGIFPEHPGTPDSKGVDFYNPLSMSLGPTASNHIPTLYLGGLAFVMVVSTNVTNLDNLTLGAVLCWSGLRCVFGERRLLGSVRSRISLDRMHRPGISR